MKIVKTLIALVLIGIVAGAGFVYSGIYNIASDEPHWSLARKAIEILRERSIRARTQDIKVPDLDDPKMIAAGAEHYSEMCVGCHLAPGVKDTEIRAGLYPKPHNLTEHGHSDAARQFWIIKHGVKMTGMPAWGTTHDDNSIWGLVAFVQKLPELSQAEYQALAGRGDGHDAARDGDGNTSHSHAGESDTQSRPAGHVDAPGTPPHSH